MLKPTTKWIPYIIILILLIITGFQRCSIDNRNKQISDYQQVEKYRNSQIDSFKNKLGQTITEAKIAQVNNSKIIKQLSDSVFDLNKKDARHVKQIDALIRQKQTVIIDSIPVPYYDTVAVDKNDTTLVPRNTVIVPPRRFKDSTPNYKIDGTVLLDKVLINSLELPDSNSLRIVEKKEKFFKPRELVIQGIHSNPLFHTDRMQMIMKQGSRPNRWQTWIKPALVGIVTATLTYKLTHLP